uniref:Kinesin-like protein n=1 Tax=Caenorhabditis japonica TaxID=281687 RepID=A0A8R1E0V5_CAEJA
MPRDITTGDQELAMADLTKQISTLVAALSKLTQVGTASEQHSTDTTKLADAISSRIPMFVYEPEDGRTFDSWYSRYKDTITKDGFSLQDDMISTESSIRVVVRARPMNAREAREGARKCVEYYENSAQIVLNGQATFAFDSVFSDTVDQETVFERTALPLVDRIFAGFNATVIAYGQTGSGKTFTMGTEDNDGTDEMRRGIIPRLVSTLFQRIKQSKVHESFKVTVSMYEVYGDNVYDLLQPDKVKLNVHGDEKNCTIVNLTSVPVTDLKGALKQLATGCHYRTKGETAMNAMSSRSHAVFTVFVEKVRSSDCDSAFSAKLQLVDLAGSERLKKTEADRMREGININAGLLNLSQVIAALASKKRHIPYRSAVITRVLQDSLGGNSFTVFIVCISPADTNSQETLGTLRYADCAKKIRNKPIMNKSLKTEEIVALQAQIKHLQIENDSLRQMIASADTKNDITITDVAQKKRDDEQKLTVLQKTLNESNQNNKMLRELNQKRLDRKREPADSEALQYIIEEELELEASAQRCNLLCEELLRHRQEITERINYIESKMFDGKKVCRRWRKARRRGGNRTELLDSAMSFIFSRSCNHAECQGNPTPDISIVNMDSSSFMNVEDEEEEFEEGRQNGLNSLRLILANVNQEIDCSLRNETVSGAEERTQIWENLVPAEVRPFIEIFFEKAVAHVKKEVELEYELAKVNNSFTADINYERRPSHFFATLKPESDIFDINNNSTFHGGDDTLLGKSNNSLPSEEIAPEPSVAE